MTPFYCDIARGHPLHGPHHDHEHGFPLAADRDFLERLALEINQAGLAWVTVLAKREGLRHAFRGFDLDLVAAMGEADIDRLRGDPAVVRHERKIRAVIENARRMCDLRDRHGSLRAWFDRHHPRDLPDWLVLMRKNFVFVGPKIVREYMTGIGYLPGAHRPECPIWPRVAAARPPWLDRNR